MANDVLQEQGAHGVKVFICSQLATAPLKISKGSLEKVEKDVYSVLDSDRVADKEIENAHIEPVQEKSADILATDITASPSPTNPDQHTQKNTLAVSEKPAEPQITNLEGFKAYLNKYDLSELNRLIYTQALRDQLLVEEETQEQEKMQDKQKD